MKNNCQNCKKEFEVTSEDVSFYEKMRVPAPTFCYLCRAQRRFAFRNERMLYKTTSGLSGKDIFTAYNPDHGCTSYDIKEWHSDDWDPMDYAEDVDFSIPFFEQFKQFLRKVPQKSRNVVMGSNSPYCNNATDPKNCYLVYNSSFVEDCMYSNGIYNSRECMDCSHCHRSEGCYQCFWCTSCTNCRYSSYCIESLNLWFSKNCVGCTDCFGCVGLRKQSYCMWNEQYSKEDYFTKLAEMQVTSRASLEKLYQQTQKFWKQFPNKFLIGIHNQNVTGSYISHSKNAQHSFLVRNSEDVKYCQYLEEKAGTKDSYDFSIWGDTCERVYETHASGSGIQNIKFCVFTQENSRDIEYSMVCSGSSNLFGCVSLRNKGYCIFNKQYAPEEYEGMVAKIKQHMNDMPYVDAQRREYKYGEFFPIEISPFGYNESLAQEYFPLTKKQALEQGYAWSDSPKRDYHPTMDKENLPDSLGETTETITDEIVQCSNKGTTAQLCTTAFRIVADELQFYKKHNLPIPTQCPNCRTFNRLDQRLGLEVYAVKCACAGHQDDTGVYTNQSEHAHSDGHCENTFQTAYDPNNDEIVYCEACYQKETV